MKWFIMMALMSGCGTVGSMPSVCEVPIAIEKNICSAVYEKRAWVAEDGSQVGCRLLVCGEDTLWRWRNGTWKKS